MENKTGFKYCLVGSGNVATQLGTVLFSQGNLAIEIISRNSTTGKNLAAAVQANYTSQVSEASLDAEIIFVCVQDDEIADVMKSIQSRIISSQILVHTSGSRGLEVYDPISANTGVFYPLQTFSKHNLVKWNKIPVFTQFIDDTPKELLLLIDRLKCRHHKISDDNRMAIHTAAVFANNFTNFNLVIAHRILTANHLPFDILKPLVDQSLSTAFLTEPGLNQTGPAKRKDNETISKHINYLIQNFPEFEQLYEDYSRLIKLSFDKK